MIYLKCSLYGSLADQVTTCVEDIITEADHARDPAKTAIRSERDKIEARVLDYIAGQGNPETISNSSFPRRIADSDPKTVGDWLFARFRSGNGTKKEKEIVGYAKAVHTEYCPYCGLYMRSKPHNRSHDTDHILPRSEYPEYSLLRPNLVLACDDCNKAKSNKIFDNDGRWLFVHPYFDTVLATKVLSVTVNICKKTPLISFNINNNINNGDRIVRHFNTMDLDNRYSDEPLKNAIELIELSKKLYKDKIANLQDVKNVLSKEADVKLSQRPNDPLGLILQALAHTPNLEELLIE